MGELRRKQALLDRYEAGGIRPYCDIGRSSSGRPLPDPTADLSTLSVLAKESGRPCLGFSDACPRARRTVSDGQASENPKHELSSGLDLSNTETGQLLQVCRSATRRCAKRHV